MNLKDCYTAFGGDYEEVMSRLRLEKTVIPFEIFRGQELFYVQRGFCSQRL